MSDANRQALRRAIGAVAKALRTADRLATQLRRQSQTVVDDAVALEAAVGRAVAALRRLQPTPKRRARR